MKRTLVTVFLVSATLLAGAALGAPIDKKQTIRLDREALVGSQVLPSGSYRVELASNPDTVKFIQAGRTVAEMPCKLALATVIYPGNAVHFRSSESGPDRLVKIVLADSKLSIEVPASEKELETPIANATDRR